VRVAMPPHVDVTIVRVANVTREMVTRLVVAVPAPLGRQEAHHPYRVVVDRPKPFKK